jgi:hypothetical protein
VVDDGCRVLESYCTLSFHECHGQGVLSLYFSTDKVEQTLPMYYEAPAVVSVWVTVGLSTSFMTRELDLLTRRITTGVSKYLPCL